MNPEQLSETTMDKQKRVLKQINVEDIEQSSLVIKNLMGKDVKPRKDYIFNNGSRVEINI